MTIKWEDLNEGAHPRTGASSTRLRSDLEGYQRDVLGLVSCALLRFIPLGREHGFIFKCCEKHPDHLGDTGVYNQLHS